jgi:hypothetical protein
LAAIGTRRESRGMLEKSNGCCAMLADDIR